MKVVKYNETSVSIYGFTQRLITEDCNFVYVWGKLLKYDPGVKICCNINETGEYIFSD